MRLKKLTLSLMLLSLVGCASHSIQSQTSINTNLDTRTVKAVNSIYHTPSFEYHGQVDMRFKPATNNSAELKPQMLEQALKLQIDQYLRAQRIPLNSKQKNDLYQAMFQQLNGDTNPKSGVEIIERIDGYLSGLSFKYDGVVDYRQKLISYNPSVKYKKENLQIEAKLPLVLDLKNHRIYANYYSFLPSVSAAKRDSDFVYLDFSNYKELIDQVDLKQLIAYLEQNSALPYFVADQSQLQSLPVTDLEKNAGVVEKVRLEMPIEDFLLQQQVFETVNKEFITKSVINFEKVIERYVDKTQGALEAKNEEDEDEMDYFGENLSSEEKAAYRASNQFYELLRSHSYGLDEEEEEGEELSDAEIEAILAGSEEAEEASSPAGEASVNKFESTAINSEQCEALAQNPKAAKIGDIQYCQYNYEIDILPATKDSEGLNLAWLLQLDQITEVFKQYQSTQLQDAQAVAALWKKHAADINQVRPKQSSGRVVNHVSIDAQGRAVYMDYQIDLHIDDVGVLDFKFDMNLDNYGQAKPINQKALAQALSFTELHKDSRVGQTAAKLLGTPIAEPKKKVAVVQSFDAQLEALASKIYDQSQSYSKTYQAVFALKLSLEQPELFKHFNTQQLNEIAQVYAYSYADESVFNPQGKALDELNALLKKHHLESTEQYDHELAISVDELVMSVIEQAKERQAWQALVKKYKQPKLIFKQQYIARFTEEHDVEPEEQAQLQTTAERLAQVYIDTRNKKLSKQSVKDFNDDDEGFIDHGLYRETFAKMLKKFN